MAPSVQDIPPSFKNNRVIGDPEAPPSNEIKTASGFSDAAVAHHQDAKARDLNEDAMDHDAPPLLRPAYRCILGL